MPSDPLYLKQNVAIEPLFNQWYAWWNLIPPTTSPLFVTNLHVKIMESFVAAPDIHVSALKNPALAGGPYINYGADRVGEVRELLAATLKKEAASLQFAAAVVELNKLLAAAGNGSSLESIYSKVPDILRGYVELTYDENNRASMRFIEPLLYRSPHYRESSQSVAFRLVDQDARKYAFSTPRLGKDGSIHVTLPFRHQALDRFFAMREKPGSVEEIRRELGVDPADAALFDTFFTDKPSPPPRRYDGDGVRMRYFGHACVLVETRDVSLLTDPVISYPFPNDLPRFTLEDLPDRIDYVLITHGHADHLMFESLLQLRNRIGTIVVPSSNSGALPDPSIKHMLRALGFPRVVQLEELDVIELPGGSITGLPFFGEHGDLNIRSKIAHLIQLKGKTMLMAADSNAIEPRIYDHCRSALGEIDMMWIGMESEGAPMSWMYGPLLLTPLQRKMDQSRRLNGSNADRAIEIVHRLNPKQVFVYAMGREPWLSHVMVMGYHENSPQLVEARKLLDYCRSKGRVAEMPYAKAEVVL